MRWPCFGLLLFYPGAIFAASSLFHVVIAEKWLAAFEDYNEEEKKAFFQGTLFPDIRYIAGLPRKATHEYGFTLEQIKAVSDPFLKGIRVHVFVDEVRERFFKTQSLKILDQITGDKILYLKFLEDEVLYSMHFSPHICQYLTQIDRSMVPLDIAPEILDKWYAMNRFYLSMRPSDALAEFVSCDRGYSSLSLEATTKSCEVMRAFCENEEIKQYVYSAIDYFLSYLSF